MKKSLIASVRDFIAEWAGFLVLYLFVSTALMQAFVVPTSSMDSTVKVGDHMIVDKLSYAPPGWVGGKLLPYTPVRRGDIFVFRLPVDIRENYVKRVIGVPGDRIRIANKVVYLNGHALDEPYTQHIFPGFEPYRDSFPAAPFGPVDARGLEMLAGHVEGNELVVPPDNYFAMGDNRDNSLDSRYWGFVPRENIVGKPLVIWWSYDAETEDLVDFTARHFVDLAQNFFWKTRWERTLKLVRGVEIK